VEAEIGESGFAPRAQAPNRPRLVQEPGAAKIQIIPPSESEEEDLLSEILKAKGGNADMRKHTLEKRAGTIPPRPSPLPASPSKVEGTSTDGDKKKRRRRRGGGGNSSPSAEKSPSTPVASPAAPTRSLAPGERITFDA
jgi:hypothetical protein